MRKVLFCLLAVATACTANKSSSADSAKASGSDSTAAVAANDEGAGRDAIGKIRSEWQAAADRKDSTAVAALYADDAVLATSGAPVATGKAEIEKTLGRMVNLTKFEKIDSKDLVVSGDNASDYGTFSDEVTLPNGKKAKEDGYYLVTLRKQGDGSWKITHHVSTTPPKAP
jgi:uncharacterized protein (TIGR02246 family)